MRVAPLKSGSIDVGALLGYAGKPVMEDIGADQTGARKSRRGRMAGYPLIDIYCHIFPERFFQEMIRVAPNLTNIGARLRNVKKLFDLDLRFREMDAFGDYRQVISLPNPPIEDLATGATGLELARIGNDAMAELCRKHPERFAGFVAAVSLTDVDGSLAEIRRAVGELGASGIQVFTSIAGRPLDDAAYRPVFAEMAKLDLPIWLHPGRTAAMTDYAGEAKSRYEMWWCFGWPYDTSVAMSRLVFSGLFDRHPAIKIVTHHCGGMIPYFDGRVGAGLDVLGSRTSDEDYSKVLSSLKRPHLDYFRDFYADTAMFGGQYGVACGLEFFGPDKVVFATDTPLGPIKPTIEVIDRLGLSEADRQKVYVGNAERLLNRKLS
jgi:aminocarboxymuconate-semialdehyde decarboxylase